MAWGARKGVAAGVVALFLAEAATIMALPPGIACYEQLWAGIRQTEEIGGERCEKYVDCPTAIKCFPGDTWLVAGGNLLLDHWCATYKGGHWDERKGRCVGGGRRLRVTRRR